MPLALAAHRCPPRAPASSSTDCHRDGSRSRPYAAAVGMVALVTGLRYLLDPLIGEQSPFDLFIATVFVAGWYVGC